jgi:hypothetical protein
MEVSAQIVVIWVATQCSLVDGYQFFRETYCFDLQGKSERGEDVIRLCRQRNIDCGHSHPQKGQQELETTAF